MKIGAHLCPHRSKIGFRNPIFDDFFSLKYDISRNVGSISIIFFCKFMTISSTTDNDRSDFVHESGSDSYVSLASVLD